MKANFVFVMILLAALLVFAACEETPKSPSVNNNADNKVPPLYDVQVSTTEPEEPVLAEPEEISCEEWAASLVPEYVTLYEGEAHCTLELTGKWLDGEAIYADGNGVEHIRGKNKRLKMEPGKLAGEDVDYYYLRAYNDEPLAFSYSKQVLNSYGEIIGTNTFRIGIDHFEKNDASSSKYAEDIEVLGCAKYDYYLSGAVVTSCQKVD